ncbi:hypothetical protein Taro_005464 [Colocasia esculenta]|uniref:Glycosyltransferase family 92 protein n=1 Tax=Colocasia esculenta TaxID=4460 RepID=A0A843TPW7_COLES|nr:hypothetical protein [Colocasia esculenta]
MEKKKRRHKKLQTAALAAGILVVLFFSFHRHLSRELLTGATPASASTTTVYNIHTQYHHHVIIEQGPQTGGSSLPVRVSTDMPPAVADGVLFPDWEALLLLRPSGDHRSPSPSDGSLYCLFHNGAKSPAFFSGVIPSSRRGTYRCALPASVRRRLPFYVPRLVSSDGGGALDALQKAGPPRELLRWNFLVYETFSTNSDLIVFAKGVNNRQGVDRPAEDLRCVFYVPNATVPAVRTSVRSSSQEVFRCPHPDEQSLAPLLTASAEVGESVRISLEIVGGEPGSGKNRAVPSVADYRPRAPPAHDKAPEEGSSLLCACTMVFNVAKFLREWVVYHSRLGVDGFILYDNGSEDGLDQAIAVLKRQGFNVTSQLWLWPKTQEAGFSHCAAASHGRCEWMMYLDVDEFAFSPSWGDIPTPSREMLRSFLPPPEDKDTGGRVGQVSMGCYEFGPSNQTAHPAGGVTQGYTCRRRVEERHKSVVRLDAVDPSLHNVVHHFRLREGYRGMAARRNGAMVVNHYKYQAWPEFKAKFRRRASAYVVDWTQETNPRSRDRTPGLGFSAVEPPRWAGRFCEVEDTRLRDVVRRWFGRGLDGTSTGDYRMEWEEIR